MTNISKTTLPQLPVMVEEATAAYFLHLCGDLGWYIASIKYLRKRIS